MRTSWLSGVAVLVLWGGLVAEGQGRFRVEDVGAIPAEVGQGLDRVARDRAVFEEVAYRGTYVNSLLGFMSVRGDPNRPGTVEGVTVERFERPHVTRGAIEVRRHGGRQWVRIEPGVVSEMQASQAFASPRTYARVGGETRVWEPKRNVGTIDVRRAGLPAGPTDMYLPEDVLGEYLSADWAVRSAALPAAFAEKALRDVVVVRRRVVDRARGERGEELTVREDFSLPEVRTATGVLAVGRVVTYSAASQWRPRRVERIRDERLESTVDLDWRQAGEAWLPVRVVVRHYAPKRGLGDAEDVPMKEFVVELDPRSVVRGAGVSGMGFSVEFPAGARVERVAD